MEYHDFNLIRSSHLIFYDIPTGIAHDESVL